MEPNWHYEVRQDRLADGSLWPRSYICNELGFAIRVWFIKGEWWLEYPISGAKLIFGAALDQFGTRTDERVITGDNFRRLGPTCVIAVQSRRELEKLGGTEFKIIADNLKSALKSFSVVDGSVPPPVESVRFFDAPLASFSDENG